MSPRPGPDLLLQMYATMLRIRRAEERARELYAAGRIPGFIHLSIGRSRPSRPRGPRTSSTRSGGS